MRKSPTKDGSAGQTRSDRWAVGVLLLGLALVAVVSGIPNSPLSPLLPGDAQPAAFLRWVGRTLHLSDLGPTPAGALAMVAVVVAVVGFALSLQAAWGGQISARRALAWGLVFHVVAFLLPLLISRDVYHYGMYGRIASLHHANPYVSFPADFAQDPFLRLVSPEWRHTPALYGPMFVQLSTVFTRWFGRPSELIIAFKALSTVASVATLFIVFALSRRARPERSGFAVVAYGWNPIVLLSTVAAGHFDSLVALSVSLAVFCLMKARLPECGNSSGWEVMGTALLTIAAMLKTPMAVTVLASVGVAVLRRPSGRRIAALLSHGAVVLAIVLAAAFPFLQSEDPILGASYLTRYLNWLAPSSLLIAAVKYPLLAVGLDTAGSAWTVVVRAAFSILALGAVALVGRHIYQRRGDFSAEGQAAVWAWLVVIVLLTAPIVWPWYVVWVLPLVWLAPAPIRVAIVAMSCLMPAVMTVAERASSPVFLGVDVAYAVLFVLPVLCAGLAWVLRDLWSRVRDRFPLEAERPGAAEHLLGGALGGVRRRFGEFAERSNSADQARTKTTPSASP